MAELHAPPKKKVLPCEEGVGFAAYRGVDAHFHLDRLARRVRGQEEMRKSRPMSLASVFTVLES